MTILTQCPIEGFPGYFIHSDGTIRSEKRNVTRFLRTRLNRGGYEVISLYNDGPNWKTVHSLVAHHFIGPRPSGMTINHKDGHKRNNRVENLEYLSLADNVRHAFRMGLRTTSPERLHALRTYAIGRPPTNRKLTESQAKKIREMYDHGNLSMLRVGKKFGIGAPHVHKIVHFQIFKPKP